MADKQSYPELAKRYYHRQRWNLPEWEKRCLELWQTARNLEGKSVNHNHPDYRGKCYKCKHEQGFRKGKNCACPQARWEALNA